MTDRVQPRQLVDAFASALNAKNADELGRLFAEDAEFVNILGMRMRGRTGIVDGHAWAFAGPLRGRQIRFDQVDELPITDDVVVLHGHNIRERQPDGPVEGLPRTAGLGDRRRHERHRGRATGPLTADPRRPAVRAGHARPTRPRSSSALRTAWPYPSLLK
jgi:uncharacterized protein (TIGR02246 family)